jgi:tetratricopeptide (TPR) repeat protein
MKMIEKAQGWWLKNEAHWRYTFSELIIGELFSAMARRTAPIKLSIIVRNLGFMVRKVPFAGRNAAYHYYRAIESAKKVGAQAMEGQAYLGLGHLYSSKGKKDKALHCFSSAIQLFKRCEAETFLKKAHEGLSSL